MRFPKARIPDANVLLIFFATSVFAVITNAVDLSICTQYSLSHPGVSCPPIKLEGPDVFSYGFSQIPAIAYGALWVFINPLYWTQVPYRLYLVAFMSACFVAQWWLVKKGLMPYKLVVWSQVINAMWGMMHWHQNVTVTSLAPFAYLLWPIFFIGILQKFPFLWELVPGESPELHWLCARYCAHSNQVPYGGWWDVDLMHWLVYVLLVFAAAWPLWLRLRDMGLRRALSLWPRGYRRCPWRCPALFGQELECRERCGGIRGHGGPHQCPFHYPQEKWVDWLYSKAHEFCVVACCGSCPWVADSGPCCEAGDRCDGGCDES